MHTNVIQWNFLKIKETLAQINRSELREDITDGKTLIEKTWNQKYKNRNDLLWRLHSNKRLEELCNPEILKENPNIARKFLPNYNSKETS